MLNLPLQTRRLANFGQAILAGTSPALNILLGPTYYAIMLNYAKVAVAATEAQIKADIQRVRLKLNGTTVWEASATTIIDLNKFYGMPFVAGQLPIILARPHFKTVEAIINSAWGTKNMETFVLEVDLASGAGASLTLTAEALVDAYEPRDLGIVTRITEFVQPYSGPGTFEKLDLPKSLGDLNALHLRGANLTAAEIVLNNNQTFINGTNSVLNAFNNYFGERNSQAGYVHFDGQNLNSLSTAIPIVGTQTFNVKPTISAADNIVFIMETLQAPLGLARAA